MKTIQLTKNKKVIIDDYNFDKLNIWKWYCSNTGYATHDIFENGKKKAILMHRLIMNCSSDKVVDHINHNKLDNRIENLRVVTQHENQLNRSKLNKNNYSGTSGISWFKRDNKWRARIMLHGKEIHLGLFSNKNEAIKVRLEYFNKVGGII